MTDITCRIGEDILLYIVLEIHCGEQILVVLCI